LILVLSLNALCLDAGVKFPQLLPQSLGVGNQRGQSIVVFSFPWGTHEVPVPKTL
jgi:hypothetical protein